MTSDIVTGSTVTRAAWLAMLYGELQQIIWDTRWLLLAIVLCIAADFRYGWGECAKRYAAAVEEGNEALKAKYKWRGSRAWRRTMNKGADYLLWVTLGTFVGKAVLANIGLPYIYGGVAMAGVAIACEACSFFGHFLYLHGMEMEQKTIVGFLKAFAVAWARRRSPDMGDALDESLRERKEERE